MFVVAVIAVKWLTRTRHIPATANITSVASDPGVAEGWGGEVGGWRAFEGEGHLKIRAFVIG